MSGKAHLPTDCGRCGAAAARLRSCPRDAWPDCRNGSNLGTSTGFAHPCDPAYASGARWAAKGQAGPHLRLRWRVYRQPVHPWLALSTDGLRASPLLNLRFGLFSGKLSAPFGGYTGSLNQVRLIQRSSYCRVGHMVPVRTGDWRDKVRRVGRLRLWLQREHAHPLLLPATASDHLSPTCSCFMLRAFPEACCLPWAPGVTHCVV